MKPMKTMKTYETHIKSSMKKMRRETPRWSENTKLLPMGKKGGEHVAWLFSVFFVNSEASARLTNFNATKSL